MITKSAQDTTEFGKNLAKLLKPKDVVALYGDLGSGKTTLTKGIAQGLGVKNSSYVNSPSFVLIREYKGRINLYHFDLYRLDNTDDIEDLGIKEYFDSDGVSVVEWAEKLGGLLPKEYLKIEISILKDNSRKITVEGAGKRYESLTLYSIQHLEKHKKKKL